MMSTQANRHCKLFAYNYLEGMEKQNENKNNKLSIVAQTDIKEIV